MDDLISRQAAIEAITDERIATNMDSVYDSELHRCKRATHRILASLPSAERHGRWITKGQDIFCSVCEEESAYTWYGASKFSNYCPNCGAKMDEVEDGLNR